MSNVPHRDLANAVRALAMDAVQQAESGHPGMPMGMADVATVLFARFLRFDPEAPGWPDRDRFVLSAGHGSMLLYGLLHLTGYEDMSLSELQRFRQLGSRTAGHPEHGHAAGIETTTGPLGQGLANAVGMALAERKLAARFGDGVVDHRTYALVGDGCLMEGISHEAASLAGHLELSKLTLLFDDNRISIDGPTALTTSEDTLSRFAAYGFRVECCDGHDPDAIDHALARTLESDKPSLIAFRTTIGFGAPSKAGSAAAHGSPLGDAEVAGARKALGWPHPPFEIPADIRQAWRAIGSRGQTARAEWQRRFAQLTPALREEWERRSEGTLAAGLAARLADTKRAFLAERPKLATRKASAQVLDVLSAELPELIGGSADLTSSNLTHAPGMQAIEPGRFGGSYAYYGVREHAMAAAMNGMALHGQLIPYGGTFLVFSDYARPAIRLSALMKQRVIYVMTHDSIGLGEDGPTHQPIEHLAALRAIPNLQVWRPADAVETLECWQLALEASDAPSILALTRQGVPALRTDGDAAENRCARGAYLLRGDGRARDVTLIATGSEVSVAVAASERLAAEGVEAAVVSMPCWERFEQQPVGYRDEILGAAPRLSVEAASTFGWRRWLGEGGTAVGINTFGASGKAKDLFPHFGISEERVAAAAKTLLAANRQT